MASPPRSRWNAAPRQREHNRLALSACEIEGIDVEPFKEPPIRRETKHPDFFRTIVLLDDPRAGP